MSKLVSTKTWRTGKESAYHTDRDCRHVGPNHREVSDDHSILENLDECDYCSGEWEGITNGSRECPDCGEQFKKLPLHLPCEEAP